MLNKTPAFKICCFWLVCVALFICDSGLEALLFVPGAMFVAYTIYYPKVSIAIASPEYLRPLVATALIKLDGSNLIYHKDDDEVIAAFKEIDDILLSSVTESEMDED